MPQNPAKGAPAPADPGPDDPAPAASGPGNEDPATDGALGIERTSDTSFVVQRAFVDALLSNQAELMRGARFAPTAPGVDPSGVVVSEIVAGSALDQLGIRDRDVLVSMNGGMLATPDGALEAYAASRDADRIELVVQREGRLVTYRYSIE